MNRHWATLVVAVVVTAYWTRVMSMVWRRRRSHAGHFIPPERLGRALRLLWIPLVALWIALTWAAWLAHDGAALPFLLRPLPVNAVIVWAAAAVAVAALALTMVCWKKMGKSWRMGIGPADQTELVFTGPYAYVRHPIYALSALLMLATVVVVAHPLIAAVGAAHVALLQWEARREERYLLQRPAYRPYAAATGRFLPRTLRPYHSPSPSTLGERRGGGTRSQT